MTSSTLMPPFVINREKEEKKLAGSQLLDDITSHLTGIGKSVIEASKEDDTTWTDDAIRLGLGGAKNVGNVLNAPGIRQALQALGAPAWIVGQGLGWTLEKAGVDPRYGHIAGEVGEWFIPFYGAAKLVKKAKQAVGGLNAISDVSKATNVAADVAIATKASEKTAKIRGLTRQQALEQDGLLMAIKRNIDGFDDLSDANQISKVPRHKAELITKDLAYDLQKRLGGTKEQALDFYHFQRQAARDITEVIRVLNALALKQEPKNIVEFMEAIEVALGTKVDYRDFIAKGKSITYNPKSIKGRQVINDLNDLNVALLNRLKVVGSGGGTGSHGHYSLGHIRAVQNLIEQGDLGANRLSNMEPEVLRTILSIKNADPNKIEEVIEILGNSARKNISDKPSSILTAQGVSRTIDEEYLRFINPKDLGSYWRKVLPQTLHEDFEQIVHFIAHEKIQASRAMKKVPTIERGQTLKDRIYTRAVNDVLNGIGDYGKAFDQLRELGIDQAILREAPEILIENLEILKDANKIVWIPPKPGTKSWSTMKAILAKNNLSIEDVDIALRTGWRILEGKSSLKTKVPLSRGPVAASKLTIQQIEERINAGWSVDFTK